MKQDSDELAGLLGAVAEQDAFAFQRLYDLASPNLFGIALAILRDRGRAEDAVQECLVRIWIHASSFDPARGAPMAWMARICRNIAVDELRRLSRVDDERLEGALEAEVPPPQPEDVMVKRCLEKIDPDRARALVSVYWEGLSHSELAERLDLPLGTVKSRIRHSLLEIRRQLR